MNLAEFRYKLSRRDQEAARGIVQGLLHNGLEPVPCEPVWEDVAALKAKFAPLSLGDAFAAATARFLQGDLVVVADEVLQEVCRTEHIRVRRV